MPRLNGLTYLNTQPASDTLSVNVSDNGNTGAPGAQSATTVQIGITVIPSTRPFAVNDMFPPAAAPAILEGSPTYTLNVLANDLTHASETAVLVSVGQPGVGLGSTAIVSNQVVYTPPSSDFFGTVTFTYIMNETDNFAPNGDSGGNSSATVTLIITNVNDAPAGTDNTLTTVEDTDKVLTTANFGFSDPNDVPPDSLLNVKITTVPAPATGTLLLNSTTTVVAGQSISATDIANGNLKFHPASNGNGAAFASFTFQVQDNGGTANTGVDTDPTPNTLSFDVTADNDAPVANPDGSSGSPLTTPEETDLVITVLTNDTDVDQPVGVPLTVSTFSQPTNGAGSVVLNGDGTFTFSPATNFNGASTFTYQVRDNQNALSNTATVFLNVTGLNDAPTAGNAIYTVGEGQTLTTTGKNSPNGGTGLLRNSPAIVTDPDSPRSSLTVSLVSGPAEGTFTFSPTGDGSFSYSPRTDQQPLASVTFTYTASDGTATSNTGTITINITATNDAPVANNDVLTATEDQTLTIVAPGTAGNRGLLFNDTDQENATLSIVNPGSIVLNGPGSLSVSADGSVTYIPPAEKFNSVSFATFQYRVTDGVNQSGLATVTIKLNEDNDAPVANPDDFTAIKNQTNQLLDVRGNDTLGPDTTANGPIADLGAEAKIVTSLTFGATTVTAVSGNSPDLTTALGGKVRISGGEVLYDSPPGLQDVTDSFSYTLSDGRGKTATANVTVDIINFVAKSISGKAFIDGNGDGLPGGATDKPLGGLTIHLVGDDLLDPNSPIAVNRTTVTEADGSFIFTAVRPGEYDVFQDQPNFIRDGVDRAPVGSLATATSNNRFHVSWLADNVVGDVPGLFFTEVGLDASDPDLIDSSGLLAEVLASSGSNGIVFNVDLGGSMDWMYSLPGWNNLRSATLQLLPGLGSAILTVRDLSGQTYTKTIYQDPHNNHGGTTPPTGSSARFRILGLGDSGEYLLRIDGTAAQFGFTLAAAFAPEGEGPATSDPAFAKSADEVFAGGEWA